MSLSLPHRLPPRAVMVLSSAAATAAVSALGWLVVVPLVRSARRSYAGYLAIGPGGIPYNVFGWALQGVIQLVAVRDTCDLTPFEHPAAHVLASYGEAGLRSYYADADKDPEELPLRAGPRPRVPGYVAPQRQITDAAEATTREAQEAFLRALAAANPSRLTILPSRLEGKGTAALFALADPAPTPSSSSATAAPREIAHAHHESSSHLFFSLPDAAQVIRRGWGERHRLSGVRVAHVGLMPLAFLFVYAPRDAREMAVWRRLVVAAARYQTGGTTDLVVPAGSY